MSFDNMCGKSTAPSGIRPYIVIRLASVRGESTLNSQKSIHQIQIQLSQFDSVDCYYKFTERFECWS